MPSMIHQLAKNSNIQMISDQNYQKIFTELNRWEYQIISLYGLRKLIQ